MIKDTKNLSIELCLAVYRITDKFPKNEILRRRMREISIDIIEFLAYNRAITTYKNKDFDQRDLEKRIIIFKEYCTIARKQRWVKEENFQILKNEYQRLYDIELRKIADTSSIKISKNTITKQKRKGKIIKIEKLSERQEKLIKYLSRSTRGRTMEDFAKALKISKKTASREIQNLIKIGLVRKEGKTRATRFIRAGDERQ